MFGGEYFGQVSPGTRAPVTSGTETARGKELRYPTWSGVKPRHWTISSDIDSVATDAFFGSTFVATGSTQTGAASLSGTGTLSVAGQHTAQASSSLSGHGTLAAVGYHEARAGASISGTGTLGLVATVTHFASASLSGHGTLTVRGFQQTGSANLAGSGTLAGTATREVHGQFAGSGSGSLAVDGTTTHFGACGISGHGTLSVAGVTEKNGSVVASGSGSLSVQAVLVQRGIALLTAVGTLTVTGTVQHDHPVEFRLLRKSVTTAVRSYAQDSTVSHTTTTDNLGLLNRSYILSRGDEDIGLQTTLVRQTLVATDGQRAVTANSPRAITSVDQAIEIVAV